MSGVKEVTEKKEQQDGCPSERNRFFSERNYKRSLSLRRRFRPFLTNGDHSPRIRGSHRCRVFGGLLVNFIEYLKLRPFAG